MKNQNIRHIAIASLSLASALALAVTSKPCEPSTPTQCTGNGNGAQCGGGNVIVISDPQPFAYYYCGGNSGSRCADGDGAKCSELLYRTGYASHITCGSTDLGWCFTSMDPVPPVSTGYDCGQNPCDDVPPGDRHQPNIVGHMAPCGVQAGSYYITPMCEPV